jgi:hypothetical protein
MNSQLPQKRPHETLLSFLDLRAYGVCARRPGRTIRAGDFADEQL